MLANREKYVFQKIGNNGPDTEEYIWEIENLPPRSQLRELEKQCHVENVSKGHVFTVNDIQFKTGLLENWKNKLNVSFTSREIRLKFSLPIEEGVYWSLKTCQLKFYSKELLQASHDLCIMKQHLDSLDSDWDWESNFEIPNTGISNWNDDVDRLRLYFLVQRVTTGRIRPIEKRGKKRKSCLDSDDTDYSSSSEVWNVSGEFFLSSEHSDLVFVCEGQEFPSHKILLSIRSPVFYQILKPKSENPDVKQGNRIPITDMTPNTLKELLRFIYYGKVENLTNIAEALIVPAHKYHFPNLKVMCEKILWDKMNSDNALAYYSLADSVQAKGLSKNILNFIRKNKSKIFPNSGALIEFTKKFPDAAYVIMELLKP